MPSPRYLGIFAECVQAAPRRLLRRVMVKEGHPYRTPSDTGNPPYTPIYTHMKKKKTYTWPYTTIRSYIQPYTAVHNQVQPLQPYTALYSHMQLYTPICTHIQPFNAISVNGCNLCPNAKGSQGSPVVRFHASIKQIQPYTATSSFKYVHVKYNKTTMIYPPRGVLTLS